MAQFKAFDSKVQINGETVLSIVDGMGAFKTKAFDILSKNGINDAKPGEWYSQQGWLNSFKEISDKMGAATLFSIGCKIPENANFPPQINSFETAMHGIDMAYHMNHKNGEIGSYKFLGLTGAKEAKMICENPYPCDFDRGIIEAMAKRFKPEHSISVSVKHNDQASCRKKGADSCEYLISWF